MNESQWLNCQRPDVMLKHLGGRTRKRKLRLFACACSRRAWRFLGKNDKDSRQAVLASEKFADGVIDRDELAELQTDPVQEKQLGPRQWPDLKAAAIWLARRSARLAAAWASQGSAP